LSIDNQLLAVYYRGALMSRPTHPKKEVEEALRHAEENGWAVRVGGAHAWGKIYCPYKDDECRCGDFCITGVWSTPKSPGNHARALRRVVDNCTAQKQPKGEGRRAPGRD
jgi:hypothetical protein